MQTHSRKITIRVRKEGGYVADSSFSHGLDIKPRKSISTHASDEEDDDFHDEEDEDTQSHEDAPNQLVVYDPAANTGDEITDTPEPLDCQPPVSGFLNTAPRLLPSVGAFTVQCASCFKWRLIPTKEKYEEIRECILENPFICEAAREWRPDISCDDPPDISQDGSRLWAIDKPNIAQPPPGWERLLRIRGEGSSKFADVYYVAPSGKRLRSMVEIHKYLSEHPEYVEQGVTLSQFSFQTPRPLQENYVRKRPSRTSTTAAYDGNRIGLPGPLEPGKADPLSWVGPDDCALQLGRPSYETHVDDSVSRPSKRQARSANSKHKHTIPVFNTLKVKSEEPERRFCDEYDP